MGRRKKTTEEFIERAIEVHGDKYDYSSVIYINSKSHVNIFCEDHGVFAQSPANHLIGNGCPMCAGNILRTTEEFISEARSVHGDRYDYSSAACSGNKKNIVISCKHHGVFTQSPYKHLHGSGCPRCAKVVRKTTEEFIVQAKEVHGDKYDYSLVEYSNAKSKVSIVCKEHAEFSQKANHHLRGVGCPKCFGTVKKTTEDFVEDARTVHGDKYNYSKVLYVTAGSKVVITCSIHKDFSQSPNHHLHGGGCPKCAKYGFNPLKPAIFYVYTFDNYAGFGITNDFKSRDGQHQRTFKKKCIDASLLTTYNMSGENAKYLEKYLKQTLPIINTGIDGFKTEAIHINDLPILLDAIKQYESI